jgi:integrase
VSVARALGPGSLSKRPLPKGGASWTLDYTDGRGRRRRVVLSSDKRVAQRLRADIIRKRDLEVAGLGAEEGQSMLLIELRDLYVADLRHHVSTRHLLNVELKLRKLLAGLDAACVRDVTPHAVIVFRDNRRCEEEQAASRTARISGRRLRVLGPDDAPRLPQAPFWRALVETGARYGELQALTWGDVDLAERLVTLRAETTKAQRQRAIPLLPALVAELVELRRLHERLRGRPPDAAERVFLSPEGCTLPAHTVNAMRVFDRLLEAASIEREDAHGAKLDIHALRHTLATRLQRSGVGLAQAQRILGHSDPKLTARIYTHLGVEDLREAVEAIPQDEPSRAPTRKAQ